MRRRSRYDPAGLAPTDSYAGRSPLQRIAPSSAEQRAQWHDLIDRLTEEHITVLWTLLRCVVSPWPYEPPPPSHAS